jgi:hypothetical protein
VEVENVRYSGEKAELVQRNGMPDERKALQGLRLNNAIKQVTRRVSINPLAPLNPNSNPR